MFGKLHAYSALILSNKVVYILLGNLFNHTVMETLRL